ncbi:MAG: Crp/Fnr family transcriptional regulator [Blastocatellales bacterium]
MPEDKKNPASSRLLAALSANEYRRILPHLESIELKQGERIYTARQKIDYAYFPSTALLSLIILSRNGDLVEAGIYGSEALVGVSLLLGADISPHLIEVQIGGTALRIRAEVLKDLCGKASCGLRHHLLRYAHTVMIQMAQMTVCCSFHTVRQRLSRWLLMAQDRIQSDRIPLTKEIIAGLIGSRRPRVSIEIGSLQSAGLIKSNRGIISIVDREGLEEASCECYRVIKEEIDDLLNTG